jgi:hypothetical protein
MSMRTALLALLVLISGCGAPAEPSVIDPEDVIGVSTAWNGTFTCEGCATVIHDLTLNAQKGTFQLVSTFQGTPTGDRSYTRQGRYTWTETVVCLNAEPPNPTECFFLQDVNTLVRLDMTGEVTGDELRRK